MYASAKPRLITGPRGELHSHPHTEPEHKSQSHWSLTMDGTWIENMDGWMNGTWKIGNEITRIHLTMA